MKSIEDIVKDNYMISIDKFLIEKLTLNKQSKVKSYSFCDKYVLFVPWEDNYDYMINNYYDDIIYTNGIKSYLIDKSKALNIFEHLPIPRLNDYTYTNINRKKRSLDIFKIPSTIKSKNELEKFLQECDSQILGFNMENHWDYIENINELK